MLKKNGRLPLGVRIFLAKCTLDSTTSETRLLENIGRGLLEDLISKRSFTDAVPVCSLLSTIFISPIAFDKRMICETILSILIEHLQHRGTYMHLHWARHLPNSAHKGLLKTL